MKVSPGSWKLKLLLSFFVFACGWVYSPVSEAVIANKRTSGAGGIEIGGSLYFLGKDNPKKIWSLMSGGGGYTYLFKSRFRLGGSGQSSLVSGNDGSFSGLISWGGFALGYTLLDGHTWELSTTVLLGGGSYTFEETVGDKDNKEIIHRESFGFFLVRANLGINVKLGRLFKLGLQTGYALGIGKNARLHGPHVTLHLLFQLPRRGH